MPETGVRVLKREAHIALELWVASVVATVAASPARLFLSPHAEALAAAAGGTGPGGA
jgi:hypothetical protein